MDHEHDDYFFQPTRKELKSLWEYFGDTDVADAPRQDRNSRKEFHRVLQRSLMLHPADSQPDLVRFFSLSICKELHDEEVMKTEKKIARETLSF